MTKTAPVFVLLSALLLGAGSASSADVDAGVHGSVVFRLDGDGGTPDVVSTPTLDCTRPILRAGAWEVECEPAAPLAAGSSSHACVSPVGIAGGAPITIGHALLRVGCGSVSATCTADWVGSGQCTAVLSGSFRSPLRCAANAQGTTVLAGAFYAKCTV